MHIGVLVFYLRMPENASLKDKRAAVLRFKSQIRAKYNVSISEVDNQNDKKTAVIALAMLNSSKEYINKNFDHIANFAQRFRGMELIDYTIEFF